MVYKYIPYTNWYTAEEIRKMPIVKTRKDKIHKLFDDNWVDAKKYSDVVDIVEGECGCHKGKRYVDLDFLEKYERTRA